MFYCEFCNYSNLHLNNYLKHFEVHSGLIKKFICGFEHCKKTYTVITSLKSHVLRFHNYKVTKNISSNTINTLSNDKITCNVPHCTQKCNDLQEMIKHLKQHIEENITIQCCFPNCVKTYSVLNSFTSHLSKCHRNEKIILPSCSTAAECYVEPIVISDIDIINELSLDDEHQDYYENIPDNIVLTNVAHFFLNLEFKLCMPASTVQYVASEIFKMNRQNKEMTENKVSKYLNKIGWSTESIKDIVDSSLDNNVFNKGESLFGTSHKRNKFYKKNFSYVEPLQIPLGIINGKKNFFHYVPIKETLKKLFDNKSLSDKLIFDRPNNEDGVLRDFTDGIVFKENIFFQNNPDALQLILYQDSFEVVNPLGSAKSKYKILAVYLSIGNFPEIIRSHVNSMQLVALCKEKIFDHSKVYGKIVEDLKDIETVGIELSSGKIIKGSLVFITGDNLGSHSLGGFTENFSRTQYFCRYCLVSRDLFNTDNGIFKTYPNRTVESYKKIITQLNKAKSSCNNNKKNNTNQLLIKGIKFNSVFNELKFYHVCLPGLPPCLGHDIFEGILAYDVKLFIDDLIKKKWFSYKLLNYRIETFKYCVEDKRDKICIVYKNSKKLSGGACQLWNFLRLLPLLISDKIKNIYDDSWKCILLLSEIIEIICAPAIHKSNIAYLDLLIYDYINLRKSLFEEPLRPKHHYLVHYPSLILMFGPLMKVWTLRFESKHCFFKRSIRSIRNFINITKSLSIKHELFQCFVRLGGEITFDIKLKGEVKFNEKLYNVNIQQAFKNIPLLHNTIQCHEIIKNGISYHTGDNLFICQKGYHYEILIGKIVIILYNEPDVYFVLEVLQTELIPHLGVYKIGKVIEYKSISFDQLISFEKLHTYVINSFLYIKPKFGLVENSL